MTPKSHSRGHEIEYTNGHWIYSDTKTPLKKELRACKKCKKMPTPEGHDACLGHIKNVTHACCGHGIPGEAYLKNG